MSTVEQSINSLDARLLITKDCQASGTQMKIKTIRPSAAEGTECLLSQII